MNNYPWLETLNDRQREAVTYRPTPLLVLAGPGSGKTRILTNRAAWFIHDGQAKPESILAVTFTNRAAEEMRERLFATLDDQASGVWIYTFHATAVRILRRFGKVVGIDPEFAIIDEDEQRHALNRMLRQADLSKELYPISEIVSYISERKNALADPSESLQNVDPVLIEVARSYGKWLTQRNVLDFDDLIRYAVGVLRQNDDARKHFHNTLLHILVDEYQDINTAQYALLKLLAPPTSSITVVADDDQAIYGWRGARPELIDSFVQRYQPHVVKLELSYRCPPNILYGAQRLIARKRSLERQRFMKSDLNGQTPIFHYIFHSIKQEQRWLITLLHKLIEERGHAPGDIGILYRTHRLAIPLEQALLQAGFKLHRLRKESFFDQPIARDIVKYLQLARFISEENFASAVNFPRRQIDELSMIQLRRLAKRNDCTIIELARRSHEYPEITPLTRAHLRRFLDLLEHQMAPTNEKASTAIKTLFEQLETFRSPWRGKERDLLVGFMAFTDCIVEADALAEAFDGGAPLIIVHPPTLDGYAAAAVLWHTFDDYLDIQAENHIPASLIKTELAEQAVLITLGDIQADLPEALPQRQIALAAIAPESRPYALTTYAWRCAQLLLIGYEALADGRFVIYDIETTGTNIRRDEIVEIAAATYEDQQREQEAFQQLVRPARGYIPRAATNIHGIHYNDVQDAPALTQVLPEFLDYSDGETVVGHNIARFDNRFIDRACGQLQNGKGFNPLFIDTLRLARRLLPDQPRYTLESLIRTLSIGDDVTHRAEDDLKQTAQLFFHLSERIIEEKEQEALAEYLPLVGLATLAEQIEQVDENLVLLNGAARMLAAGRGNTYLDHLFEKLPTDLQATALHASLQLEQHEAPVLDDDLAWMDLQQAFVKQVEAFETYSADISLQAFLDYQALLNSLDTHSHERDDNEHITLMTLHNAKGLEFPVVIIIGVEQENLPLWRTLKYPDQLAEERRVLYVGITRAQESVYLFSTRDRHDGFMRSPSRFAFEIPSEYVRRFRIDAKGRTQEMQ